jgi:hypothetical protein
MKSNVYKYIVVQVLASLLISCYTLERNVRFDNPKISYEGRILYRTDAAELSWPGTSVTMNFKGTGISATLQDMDTANYYNVIIDDNVVSKIHTDKVKRTYILATGMSSGKHQLQLFKRTEWDKGKTLFYGFELENGGKLLPASKVKKRKIEFYGNSITCGYANEDFSGKDRWFGYYQNNYESYAAITARHFNAQYQCISKSGIGIMVSWFPMIMPEMFERTDPTDSNSVWDFSQYKPDVVVVNLFQNDSWLVNMPEHESFKSRFGEQAPDSTSIIAAYKSFIVSLRNKYPKSSIVCALGSMDATKEGSPWPTYVQRAVTELKDERIFTCFFPFKNSDGHPLVEDQHAMADQLIKFIDHNIKW